MHPKLPSLLQLVTTYVTNYKTTALHCKQQTTNFYPQAKQPRGTARRALWVAFPHLPVPVK